MPLCLNDMVHKQQATYVLQICRRYNSSVLGFRQPATWLPFRGISSEIQTQIGLQEHSNGGAINWESASTVLSSWHGNRLLNINIFWWALQFPVKSGQKTMCLFFYSYHWNQSQSREVKQIPVSTEFVTLNHWLWNFLTPRTWWKCTCLIGFAHDRMMKSD